MRSSLLPIAVMLLLLLSLGGCLTQQQRAERQAAIRTAVMKMLEDRHWRITITMMNTTRYGSRTVTSDFFLEMRGDTLNSYLPYLGQAHMAPVQSPSIGLNFEKTVQNYQISHPKANLTKMEMDVKTTEDKYHYTVEIFDTGSAAISVRSINRDPISYDGNCEIN